MDEVKPLQQPKQSTFHDYVLKMLQDQIDQAIELYPVLNRESAHRTADGLIIAQHLYMLKTIGMIADDKKQLKELKENYEKERS